MRHDTESRRSGRTRWGALTIVGVLTAALCVGVVMAFVDTNAAPISLTGSIVMTIGLGAAVLLGIGIAGLVVRNRRRDR